jgi:tripartite-type tricarboxylate transporter receptor subunit TctC
MRKSINVLVLALVIMGACLIQPASAAPAYPTKPIELVVPFTAGGTSDLLARLTGEVAKKYLGQPLVIVSKPGAGGTLGVAETLQAPPDGYKLISAPSNYFSTTVYTQKIPFDPTDLVPIINQMEYRNGFAVKGDAPYKTVNDLLEYGKKNPGKLRWSHMNRGSALFMQTYLLFKQAGVQAVDVPYGGIADSLTALIGGHVDCAPISFGASQEYLKAGKLRYLMVYSEKRFPEYPNVPTAKELGFPETLKFNTLLGLYCHKNVPPEIQKTLYDAFRKTFEDPAFKAAFDKFGEGENFSGPDVIKATIREEEKLSVPFLKEWGLYVGK